VVTAITQNHLVPEHPCVYTTFPAVNYCDVPAALYSLIVCPQKKKCEEEMREESSASIPVLLAKLHSCFSG
ncbi:hypothetical protein PDJAM_G00156830, partial [Pangasius djambal]|nr:hypothetical protein [Pangasius djambal]